jgi:hypothetical protein
MQKLQEKRPGRVQNGGGRIPVLHKTGAGRVPSFINWKRNLKKNEHEEYKVYRKKIRKGT